MNPPATNTTAAARVALADAADRLFYERGISAVSMASLRDASGVSFRRMYELCPSKSDVVTLWLEHRHELWTRDFERHVEAELAAGHEPVDAVFAALDAWMVDTGFRGCGFINSHAETTHLSSKHRQLIADHKRALASYLDQLCGHGDALAVLVDGAIVQSSIFASSTPIAHARTAAVALTTSHQKASTK